MQGVVLSAIVLCAFSGVILRQLFRFSISLGSCATPLIAVLLGVLLTAFLRDFWEGIMFFGAATAQFFALVFASRMRQRGSFLWHSIASIGSNGAWFMVVHILAGAEAYILLIVPFLAGMLVGRVGGVMWAQYVESTFKLKADATRDPRFAPGKRLEYITKEPMLWLLLCGLAAYVCYGYFSFSTDMRVAMGVVIELGVFQNLFYALHTRAINRGSNVYIALTGVVSGSFFFLSTAYLFSKSVPLELIVPYICSTALGSTTGAFFSMLIERTAHIAPDTHIKVKGEKGVKKNAKAPYIALTALAVVWIFSSESILSVFGASPQEVVLPLPVVTEGFLASREVVMVSAALLFFFNNALHTVASRAGNRDHTGYHVAAIVVKGCFDFFVLSYIAANASILDIVPIAVVAVCLGSLFGKQVSEFFEKKFGARMDVTQEYVHKK